MSVYEECIQALRKCYEEMGEHNDLADNEDAQKAIGALLLAWIQKYLEPYLVDGEAWGDFHERFGLPELQNVISFAYSLGRRGGGHDDDR